MSFFREERHTRIPCSVSHELLLATANKYPNKLIQKGKVNIPATLFMLGFYIDFAKLHNQYSVVKDARIRCKDRPYETYKTTFYNGTVRNEVVSWDMEKRKPVYDKSKLHFMHKLYKEIEVLTVGDIPEEYCVNINTIGEADQYTKGMAAMDKKVNPDKVFRQIVR